jgi:hypothetical protein
VKQPPRRDGIRCRGAVSTRSQPHDILLKYR